MCKLYIFGMERSQKILFGYQISLKISIFWENGKKITSGEIFHGPAAKTQQWQKKRIFWQNRPNET